MPLQDVDAVNGCMHFIDRWHRSGVLPHHLVAGMRRGDVAFHHSKTPHLSTANTGARRRKALTNHLQAVGAGGEGDHYPWRVKVNQRTGVRSRPQSAQATSPTDD